ncbi:MAG: ABC transporter ATP-binding protein [Myxococcota bacterium]
MSPAIECRELVVRFGDLAAVDGASLRVEVGELFGFLGPNGAGKSTTISVLCTLRRPTEGTARVAGHDTWREAARVRERIGVLFQDPTLDDRLTGRENLRLHARVYGVPRADRRRRLEEAVELTRLGTALDRQVRTYSGGMKRRLELARVLMHRPSVLFLDEPTAGLDPQTRRQLWDHLQDLRRREGLTLFLTTHYMDEAERADRVAIIDAGRIIACDTPAALKGSLPKSAATRPPVPSGPSLEDVFVHLTGHAMRDEAAGTREMVKNALARRGRR